MIGDSESSGAPDFNFFTRAQIFFYSITNSQIRSVEMPLESFKREHSIYAKKSSFGGARVRLILRPQQVNRGKGNIKR